VIFPIPFKLYTPHLGSQRFPYQSRHGRSLLARKLAQGFILWQWNSYRYDFILDHAVLLFYETVQRQQCPQYETNGNGMQPFFTLCNQALFEA
jgi:hypothetical protein